MHESVRNFFQTQVDDYSQNFKSFKTGANYQFQERLRLTSNLSKGFSGKLLDCASGTGEITRAILVNNEFLSADIVDIAPNMLDRSKDLINSSNILTSCNYAESNIFDFLLQAKQCDRKYDLILCLGLIAHVGQLETLLNLLSHCINPEKGRLIFQTTLLDHFGTRLLRRLTAERYFQAKGYYISYFTLDDVVSVAQSCGFSTVKVERFGLSIPGGDRFFSKGNYLLEKFTREWQKVIGSEAIIAFELE